MAGHRACRSQHLVYLAADNAPAAGAEHGRRDGWVPVRRRPAGYGAFALEVVPAIPALSPGYRSSMMVLAGLGRQGCWVVKGKPARCPQGSCVRPAGMFATR